MRAENYQVSHSCFKPANKHNSEDSVHISLLKILAKAREIVKHSDLHLCSKDCFHLKKQRLIVPLKIKITKLLHIFIFCICIHYVPRDFGKLVSDD